MDRAVASTVSIQLQNDNCALRNVLIHKLLLDARAMKAKRGGWGNNWHALAAASLRRQPSQTLKLIFIGCVRLFFQLNKIEHETNYILREWEKCRNGCGVEHLHRLQQAATRRTHRARTLIWYAGLSVDRHSAGDIVVVNQASMQSWLGSVENGNRVFSKVFEIQLKHRNALRCQCRLLFWASYTRPAKGHRKFADNVGPPSRRHRI